MITQNETECMEVTISKPLLSICIPTFNRAGYLRRCLEAIVQQDGFDERVEVIISDNCSSDDTQDVGEYYQKKHKNIHYYRNDKNILDGNFPLSFQRANGTLLKLTNDTILYKPGAIKYMLNAVEENCEKKPQLYFLNSDRFSCRPRMVNDLEEYIGSLGFLLTWIGSLAIWKDDCNDLDTFINNASSRLGQVPYLIEHFEKHKGAVIYCKHIMGSVSLNKKDISYGLYKVFYKNFLGFIRPYVECGKISDQCYEGVRKKLLFGFFCYWIVNWKKHQDRYVFSKEENLKELVEREYLNEPYFLKYRVKLHYCFLRDFVIKMVKFLCHKTA